MSLPNLSGIFMRKICTILFLLPLQIFAQDVPSTDVPAKYVRPKYYEIGAGLNFSSFIDFATSPLTYTGVSGQYTIGTLRKDAKQENGFSMRYSSGTYIQSANTYEKTPSKVNTFFFNYARLYRLEKLSPGKWNFKVGAAVDVSGNLRQNPSLLNAGVGLETFQTLFATAKITRDISRKELKNRKFLFIRYKKRPVTRDLSFQLSPSVINSNLRNGYSYIGQSAVAGENQLFDNYKFSAFSGFRIKTALEYTRYLKNGNGIKYAYLWDAYKTGGSLPGFQMSNHIIQASLLFRIK